MATERPASPIPPSPVLKRVLFLGPTGSGKSKMINCCFNRSVEPADLGAPSNISAAYQVIGTTSSISNYVDQRNKMIYVDTIGYGDVRFKQDSQSFLLFFRELICYSSIGFNWIFLFIRFGQMTQDILTYIQSLKDMLGEQALSRCTIVFTHCSDPPTFEQLIEANQQHDGVVDILKKVNNVIFGDMDTSQTNANLNENELAVLKKVQRKKREKFMEKILTQIDSLDNETLGLEKKWFQYYAHKVASFFGHLVEKVFGKSNEMSKLYKLMNDMKKGIPVAIYYEECSICLELIVETVDHTPKACITKCGHIFHYDCLERHFKEKKNCPNCRKDLRSLPERVAGYVVGLTQIQDPLKVNVS